MRWSAIWAVDLGQPRAAFWDATPREFRALVDRVAERERRADYRAGQVAAIIANVNRDPKQRSQPYQPADFFASVPRADPSVELVQAGLEAWAASFAPQGG